MSTKKFLDSSGLAHFWDKAKEYIGDNTIPKVDNASGNLAQIDSSGNVIDSGVSKSRFALSEQGIPSGGSQNQVLAKTGSGNYNVSWKTPSYSDLKSSSKPKINGVSLDGNKDSSALGLASKAQGDKADIVFSNYLKAGASSGESSVTGFDPFADTVHNSVQVLSPAQQEQVRQNINAQQTIKNVVARSTEDASASFSGGTLTLGLPKGADAVNPFKGWFNSLAELKAAHIAIEGDSAYVKDASPATTWSIYIYDSAESENKYWKDSEKKADTTGDKTFQTSEELNLTPIDVTHLDNPASGALAKAEDSMIIKQQLRGVTLQETKVTDWEEYQVNNTSGYYDTSGVWTTTSGYKSTRIDVSGYTVVRFLGYGRYSTMTAFSFLKSDGTAFCNGYPKGYIDANMSDATLKEWIVEVPNDAKYLVCLCQNGEGGVLQPTNFYCYLESGETIKECVESIESKGVAFEDISISLLNVGKGYISSSNNKWVHVSQSGHYELSVQKGETFLIGKSGGYICRYAFLTESNLSPISLSAASYVTGTSLESFSNGEVLVTVPQDCVLYVMRGEDNAVTARPNYIKKVIGYDVIKGDDVATDFITCEKGKVFSAERGSALKAIIGDSNLIREVRIIEYDEVSGYANSDSVGSDSTGIQYKYAVFDVSGYNRVRFLGLVRKGSQGSMGWHFMNENETVIANSGGKYDYNPSIDRGYLKEYVVDIPDGAKYFVTNVYVYADAYAKLDDSNFYIYKQLGKTLSDKIADHTDALSLRNVIEPSSVVNGEAIVWKNGEAVLNPNYDSKYNLYQYLIGSELSEATLELDAKLNKSSSSIYFVYYYNMTTEIGDEGTVQIYNYLGKSVENGSSLESKSVHITLNLPNTTNCIFVNSNKGGAPMIMVSGVEIYNIQQIDSKVDSINRNNGLPDYYSTLLQNLEYNVCKIFNEHISDAFLEDSTEIHDGVDGFCFFTDPHYPRNNMMSGRIIREILNATPINKAICGGDIEDNSYWLYKPYSKHLLNIGQIKETGKDVFSVRGNHDYSVSWASGGVQSDYKYSANQVKSIIVGDAKKYGVTYNTNDTEAGRQACYYYKDYPSAKLRYIFVDAVDTNTQNGDSMLISGLSLAQMKWLRNAVDTTPQGYQLAIVSHMPVAFSLWGYNYPQGKFSYNSSTGAWTYSKHAYWTLEKSYVPYINALAQKVQSEELPIGNQNAENFDFTNAPDVAFLISGHMHKDGQCYNGFWEINCANAWTNTDNVKYSPLYYGGESSVNPFKGEIDTSVNVTNGKNTVYEDLVDCVVVSNCKGTKGTQDYVEGLISVFRVGVGANRIFHRDEVVVAVGETHEFTHSFGDDEVVWWVYDSETHQEGNAQYKSEHASIESGVLTAISSESTIVNAPQAYVESAYNTGHIEYETVLFEDKAYVTVVAYCKEKNTLEFWGVKIQPNY